MVEKRLYSLGGKVCLSIMVLSAPTTGVSAKIESEIIVGIALIITSNPFETTLRPVSYGNLDQHPEP